MGKIGSCLAAILAAFARAWHWCFCPLCRCPRVAVPGRQIAVIKATHEWGYSLSARRKPRYTERDHYGH